MRIPPMLIMSPDDEAKVTRMVSDYKRMGIYIDLVSFEHSILKLKAEQKRYLNDKVLNNEELIDRAKSLFVGKIPEGIEIHVSPVYVDRDELSQVDLYYIEAKMAELELKPSHLCRYLNIDKSAMSVLLSGGRELTKWHKAAFYYFFKQYSLRKAVNSR